MKQIRVLIETVLLMGIAYLIYEIMFFLYTVILSTKEPARDGLSLILQVTDSLKVMRKLH